MPFLPQFSWSVQNFRRILKSCIDRRDLATGKCLHALYIKSAVPHITYISNHFTLLYSKCRRLSDARNSFLATLTPNLISFNLMINAYAKESLPHLAHHVFDSISEPDLISYNTLIAAYAERGQPSPALKLLSTALDSGLGIDGFTFSSVVAASCDDVGLIKQLHCSALSGGFDGYSSVSNALISGYSRNGCFREAEWVFSYMGLVKDEVSWNSMIVVYAQQSQGGLKALDLYQEMIDQEFYVDISSLASVLKAFTTLEDSRGGMQFHGKLIKMGYHTYRHIGSGLIDLYSKCGGHMAVCRKVFEEMDDPDLVLWNTIISGYSLYEEFSEEALEYFKQFQLAGHTPDDCTFVCVIRACSRMPSPSQGRQMHSLFIKSHVRRNRVSIDNALIAMYSKCGSLQDATRVFDWMPEHNDVSFNSMIAGYAQHGLGTESLLLFERMLKKDFAPTNVTFVSVLCACAYTGRVEDGERYFRIMTEKFQMEAELQHYTCLIDLLGRAGRVERAEKLIETMPYKPNIMIWGSLLSACRMSGNVELAEKAASRCLELDQSNAAPYVVLSDLYARERKWEEVARVKRCMLDRRMKRRAGCSWIEVGN